MHLPEVQLPRQVTYAIETYKFETAIIYGLLVITMVLSLAQALQQSLAAQNSSQSAAYAIPVYPITRSTVSPATASASPAALTASYSGTSGSVWPLQGKVFTEFGVPHRPWQRTHTGIDISSARPAGAAGVTVFRQGTVTAAGRDGGLGNRVIVDHGNGLSSMYAHLQTMKVSIGQLVRPGDIVGTEGRTGTVTGTHLHFEVLQDGKPVNPRKYLSGNP